MHNRGMGAKAGNSQDHMGSALAIIAAEHHAFDASLAAIIDHIRLVRAHRIAPHAGLFRQGLSYLATFMDHFHHPKEDEFLFKAVRERSREADDILADLHADHARTPARFAALIKAVDGTRVGSMAAFEDFASLMERYAHEQVVHMRRENEELVPIALRTLRLADWRAIDAAFRANRDPLFGEGRQQRSGVLAKNPPKR